ncbi:hypothetical protein FIBSPDRAFT_155962 [Athelia psychrophila]|uniref:Uncharacterized protein n=1 Tax=Athelia psychrophila TaxID=1759441 RepID=A0A166BBK4_9AGAM|nr:hypothetical protein FIBSPDRAFT_155962 [Fibularhizoctonia sp. CBS 109695]
MRAVDNLTSPVFEHSCHSGRSSNTLQSYLEENHLPGPSVCLKPCRNDRFICWEDSEMSTFICEQSQIRDLEIVD